MNGTLINKVADKMSVTDCRHQKVDIGRQYRYVVHDILIHPRTFIHKQVSNDRDFEERAFTIGIGGY